MTVLDEIKGAISETLEHQGVKGMRWGTNKGKSSAPSGDAVRAARVRVSNSSLKVKAAKRSANAAVRPETKAKRKKIHGDLKMAHLKNPDRITANRITKGDVAIAGLLTAATGGIAAPAFTAAGVVMYGQRKALERSAKKN